MAYFKLITFGGIAPQLSPRLLADTLAQTAENVILDSGRLVPLTDNSTVQALDTTGQNSIFKYETGGNTYWLEWADEGVDVVLGPIAGDNTDRVYWTGEGGSFPRMSNNTLVTTGGAPYPNASYRLGIPAPTAAPNAAVSSGTDDGTQTKYSTSYVYTFVSAYGEEGPPSAASTVFDKVDGQTVTISNLETSLSGAGRTNTNITKKRIYRSNTGSNTTAFQFVKEVTLATASTTDNANNSALAEVIPSTYWIPPPNEVSADYPDGPLKGLTPMPNGIFAGFTGKRICFSEPYMPHAWPVAYRITLEEEIVGIKMAGQGLIVGTKGTPYLIVGADPQSMSVVRIEAAQACLSKTSMVDMGPYVLYAGADGLIAASGTDVSVVTEGIVSPEQWRADYYPSSLRGFLWEGRYVGLYTSGSNYGGFIFDPRGDQMNTLTTLTQTATTDVTGGYTDPDDNELYLIVDTSGGPKIEKFQGTTTNKTFTWKSKEYVPERPCSMSFVKVHAEAYPVTVKVYGDGAVIYNATVSTSGSSYSASGSSPTSFGATTIPEPVLRLPGGVYKSYAVEVQSAKVVNEVCIAESVDELRAV